MRITEFRLLQRNIFKMHYHISRDKCNDPERIRNVRLRNISRCNTKRKRTKNEIGVEGYEEKRAR